MEMSPGFLTAQPRAPGLLPRKHGKGDPSSVLGCSVPGQAKGCPGISILGEQICPQTLERP